MGKYKHFVGLGIAGNFAMHLEQAGEAEDFKDIVTKDETAPKGVFPFYLPMPINPVNQANLKAKKILSTYPLSSQFIKLPKDKSLNVQAEPEVALICDFYYEAGRLHSITPRYFAAYNDCSIRVKGASKISQKKNWGEYSKGLSNQLIPIDKFSAGGIMDNYSICSFLKRDNKLHTYGENIELTAYSYFHEQLIDWTLEQILTQEDGGVLESIEEYLIACEEPKEAIISIGATRYTTFGEKTYLQEGDEVFVVLYDHNKHSLSDVIDSIEKKDYNQDSMSILAQEVIA